MNLNPNVAQQPTIANIVTKGFSVGGGHKILITIKSLFPLKEDFQKCLSRVTLDHFQNGFDPDIMKKIFFLTLLLTIRGLTQLSARKNRVLMHGRVCRNKSKDYRDHPAQGASADNL